MTDSITWVGMDVHKENILTVSVSGDSGTVMARCRLLYFSLGVGAGDRKLFGGLDFHRLATKKIIPTTIRKEKFAAKQFGKEITPKPASPVSEFGGPEGSNWSRLQLPHGTLEEVVENAHLVLLR